MDLNGIGKNLNTSNVKVKHCQIKKEVVTLSDLNTSNVKVKHGRYEALKQLGYKFKYI